MSGRLAVLLVVISAVSLLGLMLLFAYAPDLRSESSNGGDTVSRSAVGFAGLKELLTLSGVPTELDRGQLSRPDTRPSLVILTPEAGADARDISEYEFIAPTLIILPKWIVTPQIPREDWVSKFGALPTGQTAAMLQQIAPGVTLAMRPGSAKNVEIMLSPTAPPKLPAFALPNVEELRSIGGAKSLLIARNYGPILAMASHAGQPVYILSDPDLMNDHGLSDRTSARAAMTIIAQLRRGTGPVRFDVTLNGLGRDPSLLRAVFQTPLVGATICSLVAALLIGWHAASRFGAPIEQGRVFARGKKILAANTADLLRIMGREGAMAARYVQSARDMALARLGVRRASAPEQNELLAIIERGTGLAVSYAELAREAETARTGADLQTIAAKAYAWRKGITRGHQ
ncbi:MAG TPA: hypothetical protein VMO78_08755 [Rhizomicrobium sp.]|nr:hypothetical protein [Rhizomicrobium sp.]